MSASRHRNRPGPSMFSYSLISPLPSTSLHILHLIQRHMVYPISSYLAVDKTGITIIIIPILKHMITTDILILPQPCVCMAMVTNLSQSSPWAHGSGLIASLSAGTSKTPQNALFWYHLEISKRISEATMFKYWLDYHLRLQKSHTCALRSTKRSGGLTAPQSLLWSTKKPKSMPSRTALLQTP